MTTAVVAIGGNAILRKGERPTLENQLRNLEETSRHIAGMVRSGFEVTLTHGNGPQVGDILLQNEMARGTVPPMPLDVCVAESQGLIGYMLQQALSHALRSVCCDRVVSTMLTRVLVDGRDEAFRIPTKPIGPYYQEMEALELQGSKGWHMAEDKARGGWRRVVPSPRPVRIIEARPIKNLVSSGNDLVIAVGGGGIPVIEREGRLVGVEAVVDKDLAAACLAKCMKESLLVMLTDVDMVYLDYGKKEQKGLDELTADEAEEHLRQGQFPAGTMGPKIEAAIDFVRSGGERAIITSPQHIDRAISSKAGTQIRPR